MATDVDNTVSAVSVSLGTITSGNIATQITNSNATGFDAGDWVRVAVGVENQGSSSKGAFDVTVRDTLPAAVDANTVRNLAFTTGAGTAVNNVEIYTGVVDISTIAGGNSVSQIAAGATNLMTGAVNFTTDAATTAQAIVDNINANAADQRLSRFGRRQHDPDRTRGRRDVRRAQHDRSGLHRDRYGGGVALGQFDAHRRRRQRRHPGRDRARPGGVLLARGEWRHPLRR